MELEKLEGLEQLDSGRDSRYWLSEVRPMGSSIRAQRWASRKASGRRVLRRRVRRSAVATHWVRPCSSL